MNAQRNVYYNVDYWAYQDYPIFDCKIRDHLNEWPQMRGSSLLSGAKLSVALGSACPYPFVNIVAQVNQILVIFD